MIDDTIKKATHLSGLFFMIEIGLNSLQWPLDLLPEQMGVGVNDVFGNIF